MMAAEVPAAKDELRSRTDEAAHLGIFGAPSFVADNELFWGNDRLEAAVAWCATQAAQPSYVAGDTSRPS